MTDRVLIIGGGIAGLSLANALAARGLRSIVIERRQETGAIDRGDVLHTSAWDRLAAWGVTSHLHRSDPLVISDFEICDQNGDQLFHCNLNTDFEKPSALHVMRHADIEAALVQHLRQHTLSVLRFGTAVESLILENGRVTGLRLMSGETLRAPLTVAAAGAFSQLVPEDLLAVKSRPYDHLFLNVLANCPQPLPASGRYYLCPDGVVVSLPLPNGQTRVGLSVPKDEAAHFRALSSAELLIAIQRRCRYFGSFKLEILERHFYPLIRKMARSFWLPGLALVGDFAHALHPTGGQGMTLAIQDADELSQQIESIASGRAEEAAALEAYSRKRRAKTRQVQNHGHRLATFGLSSNRCLAMMRPPLMRLLNRNAFLKRAVASRFFSD